MSQDKIQTYDSGQILEIGTKVSISGQEYIMTNIRLDVQNISSSQYNFENTQGNDYTIKKSEFDKLLKDGQAEVMMANKEQQIEETEMNKPFNYISNEQIEIFDQLNQNGVKYLAFGSFSINAYEQARAVDSIKLWVDPVNENISRLNRSLENSGKDLLNSHFDQELKIPLKSIEGKSTRSSLGIEFYASINGFDNNEFDKLYNRRDKIPAVELGGKATHGVLNINHMNMSDLFHNVGMTNTKTKEYNLDVIQKASVAYDKALENPLDSSKYLTHRLNNKKEKKSFLTFQGHEEKPKSFTPQYEKRDFSEIRKQLDLELVFNHYGYGLSDKSKSGDTYRIYKSGEKGDSQRLAVMKNPKGDYKMYVDINNPDFKGDSTNFVKFKEGNWPATFQVIDSILGNPTFKEKVSNILPMSEPKPSQFLNDEKLRQAELLRNYGATHFSHKNIEYLSNDRLLDPRTIFAPEFKHQILSVKSPNSIFSNTGFPLTSEKNNIINFDIRNKDYKAFPTGGKFDGIWKTNEHAALSKDAQFLYRDKIINLENGTIGTLSKSAGKDSFHIDHPIHGQLSLPVDKDKHAFDKVLTNRIIISESPIDSLSYHQLVPPKEGEYRRYISAAGNPSREQKIHISNMIGSNPQAQFVIGMDGNPPGNRFAINFMAVNHPQRDVNNSVIPSITYYNASNMINSDGSNNPTKSEQAPKEIGYNILKIEVNSPKVLGAVKAKKANDLVVKRILESINKHQTDSSKKAVETENSRITTEKTGAYATSYEVKFPNNSKMLGAAVDQIVKEINTKDGQPLIVVIRPSSIQNDFNDVLKDRKGLPLPESSNLSLSRVPLLSDYVQKKKQSQIKEISASPSVSPNEASIKEPTIKAAAPEAISNPQKNRP